MKKLIFISALTALVSSSAFAGTKAVWDYWGPSGIEFGISTAEDLMNFQEHWYFENGYNGSFGMPYGADRVGWGQTFDVSATRKLSSIFLRVYAKDSGPETFEVAVFEFDVESNHVSNKIAHVERNTSDFFYSIYSTPISEFDFSDLNITLDHTKTYFLGIIPSEPWDERKGLHIHAMLGIPEQYSQYVLTPVPEPAALLFLGLGGLILRKRK